MGKADYDKMFSGLIANEVKAVAPQSLYVPGSPEVGDLHYWEVWHGKANPSMPTARSMAS